MFDLTSTLCEVSITETPVQATVGYCGTILLQPVLIERRAPGTPGTVLHERDGDSMSSGNVIFLPVNVKCWNYFLWRPICVIYPTGINITFPDDMRTPALSCKTVPGVPEARLSIYLTSHSSKSIIRKRFSKTDKDRYVACSYPNKISTLMSELRSGESHRFLWTESKRLYASADRTEVSIDDSQRLYASNRTEVSTRDMFQLRSGESHRFLWTDSQRLYASPDRTERFARLHCDMFQLRSGESHRFLWTDNQRLYGLTKQNRGLPGYTVTCFSCAQENPIGFYGRTVRDCTASPNRAEVCQATLSDMFQLRSGESHRSMDGQSGVPSPTEQSCQAHCDMFQLRSESHRFLWTDNQRLYASPDRTELRSGESHRFLWTDSQRLYGLTRQNRGLPGYTVTCFSCAQENPIGFYGRTVRDCTASPDRTEVSMDGQSEIVRPHQTEQRFARLHCDMFQLRSGESHRFLWTDSQRLYGLTRQNRGLPGYTVTCFSCAQENPIGFYGRTVRDCTASPNRAEVCQATLSDMFQLRSGESHRFLWTDSQRLYGLTRQNRGLPGYTVTCFSCAQENPIGFYGRTIRDCTASPDRTEVYKAT
ncbi:hypothetical protein J6590_091537 [Homalodisca vitripennis]|nr:hypothetical protein J6590_091537 [Homalodisca vitripennis]